jgi:hypothetical protein
MNKNIIWAGALGVGLYFLSKKPKTTTVDLTVSTIDPVPTMGGPSINGNNNVDYTRDRRIDWYNLYRSLVDNVGFENASQQVWGLWNNENNPLKDHFPSQNAFLFNLLTYRDPSSINSPLTIQADDEPIYNTWSNWWNDIEYWGCPQWQIWYDKNALKYGQQIAKEKFVNAWSYSDNWAWTTQTAGETCGIDCDFVNYFRSKGIDVARFGVQTTCNLVSIPTNLVDATANLTEGIEQTTYYGKTFLPIALVGAGLYLIYRYTK